MRLQGKLPCTILQAKLLTKPYLTLSTLQAGVTLSAHQPAQQAFPIELLRESQSGSKKKQVEGGGGGEKRKPFFPSFPSPSPVIHFFFCSCPNFLDEPREETLATQAICTQKVSSPHKYYLPIAHALAYIACPSLSRGSLRSRRRLCLLF